MMIHHFRILSVFTWSVSYLLTISGQTIKPHRLCEHTELTVEPGSWGVIEYRKDINPSPASCQLTINGFTSNRHISLSGLDLSQPAGNCHTYPKVTVNNLVYCVKGDKSNNKVVIQLVDGQMVVSVDSMNSKNFSFNYYSNVAKCDDYIDLTPDVVSQLSGMLASSFNLNEVVELSKRKTCDIRLFELPSPPASVRFDLLYTSGISSDVEIDGGPSDVMFAIGQQAGSSLLVTTRSTRQIELQISPDTVVEMNFLIRFTVLYCEDLLGIDSRKLPGEPWLPGIELRCDTDWMLADNTSTAKCEVNNEKKTSEWNNYCLPKPWCKDPPITVNNTVQVRRDNKTVVYTCTGTPSVPIDESDRTSTCQSSDPQTVPWQWTPISFACPEPRCDESPPQVNNAVYSLSKDNLTATYRCTPGYILNSSMNTPISRCTSSDPGTVKFSWSSLPHLCIPGVTEDVQTEMKPWLYTAYGAGGTIIVVFIIIGSVILYHRKKSKRRQRRTKEKDDQRVFPAEIALKPLPNLESRPLTTAPVDPGVEYSIIRKPKTKTEKAKKLSGNKASPSLPPRTEQPDMNI